MLQKNDTNKAILLSCFVKTHQYVLNIRNFEPKHVRGYGDIVSDYAYIDRITHFIVDHIKKNVDIDTIKSVLSSLDIYRE